MSFGYNPQSSPKLPKVTAGFIYSGTFLHRGSIIIYHLFYSIVLPAQTSRTHAVVAYLCSTLLAAASEAQWTQGKPLVEQERIIPL